VQIRRDRSGEALRSSGLGIEKAGDERLSRDAEEHRKAECLQLRQRGERAKILLEGLAEPDARIEHDAVLRHASTHRDGG
jgi:hypothetical protein